MGGVALVCIDDAGLTASVVKRFGELGWECIVDDTIVGTRGLVVRHAPDVVLLDARALEVLRALKADARTRGATVVMVSQDGDFERRQKCLDAGALAFVGRKSGFDVIDSISEFVEHGRSGAVEVTPASPPSRPAPAAHV